MRSEGQSVLVLKLCFASLVKRAELKLNYATLKAMQSHAALAGKLCRDLLAELTMRSGSVADQQEIDGTAISFKH